MRKCNFDKYFIKAFFEYKVQNERKWICISCSNTQHTFVIRIDFIWNKICDIYILHEVFFINARFKNYVF